MQTVGFALIAIAAGALVTRWLSHRLVYNLHRIPYRTLMYTVLAALAIGTIILSGGYGLIILITATSLGITATLFNVKRSACMAALIIPTILYYADITVISLL